MDLYRKLKTEAFGGSYYFMTLIDDYSRRIWIYFLKTKDHALGKFKEWHVMVEKESREKLEMLRSNRGGKFTLGEFKVYIKSHEIKRQQPPPNTTQQNRVAKSKNHVIYKMVRSMLKGKWLLMTSGLKHVTR